MNNPLPQDLIPEYWADDVFIAGGYAVMPERATDIDTWITVPVENNLHEVREELLDHLRTEGFVFEEQGDRLQIDAAVFVDAYNNLHTRKVAKVVGRTYGDYSDTYRQPIHLLVTNGVWSNVLDSFDISTHQMALIPTRAGEWRQKKGTHYTAPGQPPVILKMTPTTPGRFDKIIRRYGDLNQLVTSTGETQHGF